MKKIFILSLFILIAPVMMLAQSTEVKAKVETKKEKVSATKLKSEKSKKSVKGTKTNSKTLIQAEKNNSSKGVLVNALKQEPIEDVKKKKK